MKIEISTTPQPFPVKDLPEGAIGQLSSNPELYVLRGPHVTEILRIWVREGEIESMTDDNIPESWTCTLLPKGTTISFTV